MTDTVPLLTRRADLAPSSTNRNDGTVEAIWSTGAPVRHRDMAGQYVEPLSLAPEAVDLSRLQGASVLDAHRQSAVRDALGSVQSAAVDGQRGTALIRFSTRPEVEPLWQDVLLGILRHVSVGYSVEDGPSLEPMLRVDLSTNRQLATLLTLTGHRSIWITHPDRTAQQ